MGGQGRGLAALQVEGDKHRMGFGPGLARFGVQHPVALAQAAGLGGLEPPAGVEAVSGARPAAIDQPILHHGHAHGARTIRGRADGVADRADSLGAAVAQPAGELGGAHAAEDVAVPGGEGAGAVADQAELFGAPQGRRLGGGAGDQAAGFAP